MIDIKFQFLKKYSSQSTKSIENFETIFSIAPALTATLKVRLLKWCAGYVGNMGKDFGKLCFLQFLTSYSGRLDSVVRF